MNEQDSKKLVDIIVTLTAIRIIDINSEEREIVPKNLDVFPNQDYKPRISIVTGSKENSDKVKAVLEERVTKLNESSLPGLDAYAQGLRDEYSIEPKREEDSSSPVDYLKAMGRYLAYKQYSGTLIAGARNAKILRDSALIDALSGITYYDTAKNFLDERARHFQAKKARQKEEMKSFLQSCRFASGRV